MAKEVLAGFSYLQKSTAFWGSLCTLEKPLHFGPGDFWRLLFACLFFFYKHKSPLSSPHTTRLPPRPAG